MHHHAVLTNYTATELVHLVGLQLETIAHLFTITVFVNRSIGGLVSAWFLTTGLLVFLTH